MPKKLVLTISEDSGQDRKCPEVIRVNLFRLSQQTGYTKSHLSRVLRGERNPSVPCLSILALALGMTMDETLDALGKGRVKVED